MQDKDQQFHEGLRPILSDLGSLDPADLDSVVRAGIALEEVYSGIAQGSVESNLLAACLEGLQTVYEGDSPDAGRLVRAIAGVVSAIVDGTSLPAAGTELWAALDREDSPCPFIPDLEDSSPCSSEVADSLLLDSLDDIAAYIVQADPSDTAAMPALSSALGKLAVDPSASPAARQFLMTAVQHVDTIAAGRCSDPEDEWSEVGHAIESAIDTWDDVPVAPAASVTKPVEATVEPVVAAVAPAPAPAPRLVAAEETVEDSLPADTDAALMGEFIAECRDYIERAEVALLGLETNPEDTEAVNTVFRAFHTIKGTSAFLGLNRISEFAHKAESLLSRARDKEIRLVGGYADLALQSVDQLRDLIQSVQDALGGAPLTVPDGYFDLLHILADPEASGVSDESGGMTSTVPRIGDILEMQSGTKRESLEEIAAAKGDTLMGEAIVRAGVEGVADVAKALRTQKKIAGAEQSSGTESSIRVTIDRLDRLIDTVGELVIAQSMVAQDEIVVLGESHELARKVTQTGKIVREIQYLSMAMRMVPLKPTFQKMARIVRDLARKSGKQVNFVTEGEDTEIDRNLVDVINDPLVHMVRNAADHGIELPEDRIAAGKPAVGTVQLLAYHSGGNVVVEMRDDGKGLSREKIIAKAISKGMIESDKGMSDHEVFNLIFEPGFSTAEKLTEVSGRGVGLDVVRRNVESARGRVEITSETGKGTTFIVKLPMTLAVTDGMLVKVGEERFIIPTINIHLSFRPTADSMSSVIGKGEMVMLRGELMPIFRLHRMFGIKDAVTVPSEGLLVVIDDGDRKCALLVDELLGQQHVVAKALGQSIGKVPGISGGAILGDGKVGLILDVAGIASVARQSVAACDMSSLNLELAA